MSSRNDFAIRVCQNKTHKYNVMMDIGLMLIIFFVGWLALHFIIDEINEDAAIAIYLIWVIGGTLFILIMLDVI